MGFFSWIKSDDQEPVRNRYTEGGPTPCKMLDDTGREFIELNYEGYGVFDGMDYYALVAYMNGTPEIESPEAARDIGINLCDLNRHDPAPDHIKTPRIVSLECTASWQELEPSKCDPNQGYW